MQTGRSWVQIPQEEEGNGEGGGSFEAGVGVVVGVVVGVWASHGIYGVGTLKKLVETIIASHDAIFEILFQKILKYLRTFLKYL